MKEKNMKTFDQYKTFLQSKGIPGEVIESCRSFVLKQMEGYTPNDKIKNPLENFGKCEYSEIQSQQQVVNNLKHGIVSSTIESDQSGRDITLRTYAKILKSPFNLLLYTIAKGYYLFYFDIEVADKNKRKRSRDKNLKLKDMWIVTYDRLFLGEDGYLTKREKNLKKLMMKKLEA
tara:strand:+ start:51 stop:575 length:525 start_codon:yes stop_codon:yes gene_type:complete